MEKMISVDRLKMCKIVMCVVAAMAMIFFIFANKSSAASLDDKCTLSLKESSSWSNNGSYGKVVNAELKNITNSDLSDWSISLKFPVNISLSGSWGANFVQSGNMLVITPAEYNATLKAKSSISIGFIINSTADFNVDNININYGNTAVPTVTVSPTAVPTAIVTQAPTAQVTQTPITGKLSAKEIVDDMKVGWNLGNTLDSLSHEWMGGTSPTNYETAWGAPVTTKALIKTLKDAGFNTVRIPVSWGEKMDSNNKIDEAWINRVQEIVDYCMEYDMYAIVNTHHETDWLYPTYEKEAAASAKLEALWTQVATKFKDYDQHLVFETMNETRLVGTSYEWTSGCQEAWDVINTYNKVAVKAIRNVGGNNSVRAIMVPDYGANFSAEAVNALQLPDDDMLILSVHAYSPYWFSMVLGQNETWGTDAEKSELNYNFDAIKNAAKAKGIPVVIGEFGSIDKNNTASRVIHAGYYSKLAKEKGFTVIWWDNSAFGANVSETYGIINRNSLNWVFPDIAQAIVKGAE